MNGVRRDSADYYKLMAMYRRALISHDVIPPEVLRSIAMGALEACEVVLQTFDAYRSVIDDALEQHAAREENK
jgi:hypothetical protein